jgi:hypothetical protein
MAEFGLIVKVFFKNKVNESRAATLDKAFKG